ncbi:MAG: acyl transferase [Bacteroidetes bacterium]|nr:acyl transferase [Bacteroidota bacterium]
MRVNPLKISKAIFSIRTEQEFNVLCLEIFRFQSRSNNIYKSYLKALGIDVKKINHFSKIPFIPIEFFRDHLVYASQEPPEMIFNSSGTSGMPSSRHAVADVSLYEQSFNLAFERFYGDPADYRILALLPSYLERTGSSLIYMAQKLIEKSRFPESGFYLEHTGELIHYLKQSSKKTILLGVSFALLDLAEVKMVNNPELVVMETGGMKGRRKEIVREELHHILKTGFGVETIHSEYGMTEMLTQAYSQGEGRFRMPPWANILIRDTNDPLSLMSHGKTGGINVIDLANLYSCSFIATQDLGKTHPDGSFEVLGRFDTSDIRGCNLMVL